MLTLTPFLSPHSLAYAVRASWISLLLLYKVNSFLLSEPPLEEFDWLPPLAQPAKAKPAKPTIKDFLNHLFAIIFFLLKIRCRLRKRFLNWF